MARGRRKIGAAITLTGLEIALQTGRPNLYDTSGVRAHWCLAPSALMDDPRPLNAPNAPPASGPLTPALTPPPAADSTFELVERAKSGDREALNHLFTR